MSVSSDNLSSLARSKLSLSTSRDVSLHKWVLLKNSILSSPSLPNNPAVPTPQPELHPAYRMGDNEEEDEEVLSSSIVDSDAFMFPLVDGSDSYYDADSSSKSSEAQWLDSLLETLGDDEDDEDYRVDSADSPPHHHHLFEDDSIGSLPADDDEFIYSPRVSPMSSSDDLPSQPYYSSPISVPYTVPYPPLVHAYHHCHPFDSSLVSSLSDSLPEAPLPYHDVDDLEDLPVPDAIEDTSDDESDAPTTPSLGRSSSTLSFDPASIPSPLLPPPSSERSRLRHSSPRVYVDSDDTYFYTFEVDPLPFRHDEHNTSYNGYSGC
ncbi:hypothetical protein CPB83DRAFT_477053 [Crepidotus variabilis]|uniref:Uncharacterized protein n=1 Tax=Crepidotus variabilis TaxID=179855 RepID=A0A9P6EPC4_9AGAR|nr:hypothetical protein CPB83DRAFT_477053 [Crepidotus variabilis]